MGLADRPYERDDEDPRRNNYSGYGTDFTWRFWTMTIWIIIVTIFGTLYQMATMGARTLSIADNTGYFAYDSHKVAAWQIWRLVTYPFFGGNIIGTLFTLMALYLAGNLLEPLWGRTRMLMVYLLTAAAGAGAATLYTHLAISNPAVQVHDPVSVISAMRSSIPANESEFADMLSSTYLFGPTIPVLALFLTAAFRFPNQPVGMLFIPINFPFKIFGWVIGGFMVLCVLLRAGFAPEAAGCLAGALLGFLLIKFPILLGFSDTVESGVGYIASLKTRFKEHQRIKALKAEADLQAEVDRILDKVRQHRLDSLTEAEKRTLKRATDLQNKKQATRL